MNNIQKHFRFLIAITAFAFAFTSGIGNLHVLYAQNADTMFNGFPIKTYTKCAKPVQVDKKCCPEEQTEKANQTTQKQTWQLAENKNAITCKKPKIRGRDTIAPTQASKATECSDDKKNSCACLLFFIDKKAATPMWTLVKGPGGEPLAIEGGDYACASALKT